MKIQQRHYEQMNQAITYAREHDFNVMRLERDSGDMSDMRLRWDILRATQFFTPDGFSCNGITWICDNLYPYMNDNHIDTALRSITGLSDNAINR
jgi:hypothetical protein